MMDIDALIIELIESGRQATGEELSQIVAHVAQAPFASRLVRPPRWLREALARLGIEVPARVPASEAHLLKRVYYDQQWPVGTTTDQFMADLRLAIQHPDARAWTYEYFGEPCIGLLGAIPYPRHAWRQTVHLRGLQCPARDTYDGLSSEWARDDFQRKASTVDTTQVIP